MYIIGWANWRRKSQTFQTSDYIFGRPRCRRCIRLVALCNVHRFSAPYVVSRPKMHVFLVNFLPRLVNATSVPPPYDTWFYFWGGISLFGGNSQIILLMFLIFLPMFRPSGGRKRILLEKLCRMITSRPDISVVLKKSRAKHKTMSQHE